MKRISYLAIAGALVVNAVSLAEPGVLQVKELGAELRAAIADKDTAAARRAVEGLAEVGGRGAYDQIIGVGLRGGDYELERYIGRVLVACEEKDVRTFIYERAAGSRFTSVRIVLLAVIARWPDDRRTLDVLHDAVAGANSKVAFAALKWIRKIKSRASALPLVEALAAREEIARNRLYFDIRRTLQFLSDGEADFDVAADWRNYWKGRGRAAKPKPKKKKKAGKNRTVVGPPRFFNLPIESDRILFIIDTSTSMTRRDPKPVPGTDESGRRGRTVVKKKEDKDKPPPPPPPERERMLRVKQELIRVVKELPSSTRFGILSFSHVLNFWGGTSTLRPATEENRDRAVTWVSTLTANGATRTDLALKTALSVGDLDTIYLLTDGRPKDQRNQTIDAQHVLELVKRHNRFQKVRIHTISFQQIIDKAMRGFVRDLAAQNDGSSFYLP